MCGFRNIVEHLDILTGCGCNMYVNNTADDVTQDTHYLLANYGLIDPPLMQWRPYGKKSMKKAAAT